MSGRSIDRVLFVRSTNRRNLSIVQPLGILYLVGALRRDLDPPPGEMRVIDYALSGSTPRSLSRVIEDFAPDMVGISGLTVESNLMLRVARLARESVCRPVVVAGGPHATSDPAHLLDSGTVDYVVLGEGEHTLPELIDCLRRGGDPREVPGLALPGEEGKPLLTPRRELLSDLDQLPEPAWDAIPLADYSAQPVFTMCQSLRTPLVAAVMTSRGCPFGCFYCHKYFGRKVRARSPAHVIAEMELLYHQHGVREFHLIDDFFNFDLARVREICRLIGERGLVVSLAFPNGIRGDQLDEETLRAMKQAGTYKLYVAVESGSERVQKYIGKRMNLDALQRNITIAARLGISVSAFFMIGFPTETREEMEQTIRFALRSKLHGANFYKVIPFPGTRLADIWAETYPAPREGATAYEDYMFHTRNLPAPPERMKLLDEMQVRAYRRFYGNPRRSATYLVRHPNKRLAVSNLWAMFRNVAGYYRDRWIRPETMRRHYFSEAIPPERSSWKD